MSGKEIRTWAKEEAEGNRLFFALNHLMVFIPSILFSALSLLARRNEYALPFFSAWPFHLAGRVLNLCLLYLAVTLVETGIRGKLTEPFRRGDGKRLFLVAFFLWGVSLLISIPSNQLYQRGQELMASVGGVRFPFLLEGENWDIYHRGQQLSRLGTFLSTAGALLCGSILFPVGFLLFLKPERSAGQVIREGTGLGAASLLTILAFQIRLFLPLVGCLIVSLLFFAFLNGFGFYLPPFWIVGNLLIGAVVIGLMVWYLPYIFLAQARFARELVFPGEKMDLAEALGTRGMVQFTRGLMGAPPQFRPSPKTMRLHRGDGWYYRDHKKGPVRKGPLERT